jgi:hypothetical protein
MRRATTIPCTWRISSIFLSPVIYQAFAFSFIRCEKHIKIREHNMPKTFMLTMESLARISMAEKYGAERFARVLNEISHKIT